MNEYLGKLTEQATQPHIEEVTALHNEREGLVTRLMVDLHTITATNNLIINNNNRSTSYLEKEINMDQDRIEAYLLLRTLAEMSLENTKVQLIKNRLRLSALVENTRNELDFNNKRDTWIKTMEKQRHAQVVNNTGPHHNNGSHTGGEGNAVLIDRNDANTRRDNAQLNKDIEHTKAVYKTVLFYQSLTTTRTYLLTVVMHIFDDLRYVFMTLLILLSLVRTTSLCQDMYHKEVWFAFDDMKYRLIVYRHTIHLWYDTLQVMKCLGAFILLCLSVFGVLPFIEDVAIGKVNSFTRAEKRMLIHIQNSFMYCCSVLFVCCNMFYFYVLIIIPFYAFFMPMAALGDLVMPYNEQESESLLYKLRANANARRNARLERKQSLYGHALPFPAVENVEMDENKYMLFWLCSIPWGALLFGGFYVSMSAQNIGDDNSVEQGGLVTASNTNVGILMAILVAYMVIAILRNAMKSQFNNPGESLHLFVVITVAVMMISILTSTISASCSFYSYTPYFPPPSSSPHPPLSSSACMNEGNNQPSFSYQYLLAFLTGPVEALYLSAIIGKHFDTESASPYSFCDG